MNLTAQLSKPRYELRRILGQQLGDVGGERDEFPSGPTTSQVSCFQTQRRLTDRDVKELVQAYGEGANAKELAGRFGIHRVTVAGYLKRAGVPIRHRGLSPDQVPEAARLDEQGLSLARVAEKFGVDAQTVANTLRRAGVPIRPRRGWLSKRTKSS